MNWEFLMGLLLPAYGFGYVWLIKTARDDPPMYAEVANHLKMLLATLQLALIVTAVLVIFVASNITPQFKQDIGNLTVVALILIGIVQQSFPFFRRIAALPPKSGMATQEKSRRENPIAELE